MNRAAVCFFPLTGISPCLSDRLKKAQNGRASSFDSSSRIRLLNPFGPDPLPIESDFRTDSISKGMRTIESRLDSILYDGKAGSSAYRYLNRRPYNFCRNYFL